MTFVNGGANPRILGGMRKAGIDYAYMVNTRFFPVDDFLSYQADNAEHGTLRPHCGVATMSSAELVMRAFRRHFSADLHNR